MKTLSIGEGGLVVWAARHKGDKMRLAWAAASSYTAGRLPVTVVVRPFE